MRVKVIEGHPNYSISDTGRVFNNRTGRELKPQKDNNTGYYHINLGVGKNYYVHRLVGFAFVKNNDPLKFNQVNHLDGIKTHNDYRNLEWTDPSGNIKHAYANGLKKPLDQKGIKNGNVKLTEKQVHQICEMLEQGLCQGKIADIFNVSSCTISCIKCRRSWVDITVNYNFGIK